LTLGGTLIGHGVYTSERVQENSASIQEAKKRSEN
jgi:hypothetical protein